MISVYPSDEKLFNNNGIKILHPQKAVVKKQQDGDYYLEIKDNIENLEYYQSGLIIRVNTPWGKQGFRVANPKISNKTVEVKAKHLFYDSLNYIIKDSYVVSKNCNDALDHLNNSTDIESPFTVLSDVSRIDSYRCVRTSLHDAVFTIQDRWGGHIVRDNFKIEIRNNIGQDRNVVLSYGKNIKDIKAEEEWDNVVTKLLPVGKDGLLLPEVFISISEILYDIPYSKVISFNQEIKQEDYIDENGDNDVQAYETALITDLRNQATAYLEKNKIPKVNYTLSAYLKDISDVGDVIYVKHPKCNIDITTNVISIEYDCIKEEYSKIEFGNFKNKLSDLITNVTVQTSKEVETKTNESYKKMHNELIQATTSINNIMNDSFVIYDGDKILIVDKLPKEQATNVIKINNAGIGFSKTGINGTFNSAWTIDGTFDAQKINVINLVADMIKGGTLKLGSNLNESGIIELYDESNRLISTFDKNGLIFYCDDNSYIKINPEVGFAGFNASNEKTYWVDGDEFHQKKSVVEEEITIASRARIIPATIYDDNGEITNDGVGFVSVTKE